MVKWLVAAHVFAITVFSLPRPPEAMRNGVVVFQWPTSVAEVPAFASELPDWFLYACFYHLRSPELTEVPGIKGTEWAAHPMVQEGPLTYFLLRLGTWQYWDMFAPNPADTDVWVDAEVEYADGTKIVGGYPRMFALEPPQKYMKERYRKFLERAHMESNSFLWPIFAQRIALEQTRDPSNLPVRVRLKRHFFVFPGPDVEFEEEYSEYVYHEHQVDKDAILRAKGWQ